MRKITTNVALEEAYLEEMRKNRGIILFGEDVQTGCGASPHMLIQQEMPERLVPMPICEQLLSNAPIGMALSGMRPIAEIGAFEDFLALAHDGITNQAAKVRFWSHGKVQLPVVYVTVGGVGNGCGCNHSQIGEAWLANVPGIKIVIPTTAADHKGLMKTAIRDNDPVLFLINRSQLYLEDEVPEDEDYTIPFGKARIAREGKDVTIVCWQRTYQYVMELMPQFEKAGIDAEVIDPRTLCPFDKETIIESVKKTGRLVVTHEAPYKFGPGAEILAAVFEAVGPEMKAAPVRACTPMTAIPALSPEMKTIVTPARIREAVFKVMGMEIPPEFLAEDNKEYVMEWKTKPADAAEY